MILGEPVAFGILASVLHWVGSAAVKDRQRRGPAERFGTGGSPCFMKASRESRSVTDEVSMIIDSVEATGNVSTGRGSEALVWWAPRTHG